MVTGVSAMECASFASVFPVHGAMISASSSFLGPMGSTSAMVCSGLHPQISSARLIWALALPKRLSMVDYAKEKMGVT